MAGNRIVPIFYRGDKEVSETYELTLMDYDIEGDIAYGTLNHPESMNGMSTQSFWEMFLILEAAKRDDAVKVLVWSGVGKAFCAGMSMKPIPTTIPEDVQAGYLAHGIGPAPPRKDDVDFAAKGFVMQLMRFPKFCVVAVNGVAVGGGVTFPLMLADYVIACPEVKFRMPFTDLGFTPELASSFLLPRNIGMMRAKQLILLAEWFDAAKALEWGLINEVVPAQQLREAAKAVATRAAGLGQNAIRLSKQVMHQPILERLESHMDLENTVFLEAFQAPEGQQRFIAKSLKVNKSKL